jgi:acyl transferase domain-containing protein
MSVTEALLLDPQQRLLLESVHEAIQAAETSGTTTVGGSFNLTASSMPGHQSLSAEPSKIKGTTGVYVGVASSDHGALVATYTTLGFPGTSGRSGAPGPYHATANALSVIAGRVSFVFGLQGESSISHDVRHSNVNQ